MQGFTGIATTNYGLESLDRHSDLVPNLQEELGLKAAGYGRVAGVDEAGRGSWAGPVFAAAVVLSVERTDLLDLLAGVRDSKQLSAARRESLFPCIVNVADGVGIGQASAKEIDAHGIVPATQRAMGRAVAQLQTTVDALLIDYLALPAVSIPQRTLPKADVRCLSVAAASIVAKVSRDRHMVALDGQFPGYGFARHKGYGTAEHRQALARLGPTPVHRLTWKPFREAGDQ